VGGYNSTAGAFVGTVLSTNEPNGSIDQGTGRLWVDADGLDTTIASDDNQLNVWVDTVGFTPVTSTPTQRLGSNLIYNGSFEITDGTGVLASTTVASGWADPNTATFAYDSVNDSTEGDGVAFEVIANGGANEAATQTLAGLKESTVYTLRARVRPVVGTCELLTTGGTVNVTDTSAAASGVFETLEGNFTTTAAPADVVVRLESNVAADECDWDHVTVFEQAAVVAPPGLQWATATQSVSVAVPDAFATMLTVSVTKPSAGYLLLVLADWTQENGGGGGPSEMRVQESCAGGGPTTVIATNYEDTGDAFTNSNYGGGHFLNFSALPGSTCVYTLQAQDSAAGANACVVTSGAQSLCRLSALLIPTR